MMQTAYDPQSRLVLIGSPLLTLSVLVWNELIDGDVLSESEGNDTPIACAGAVVSAIMINIWAQDQSNCEDRGH